jgi:hypothetical protein
MYSHTEESGYPLPPPQTEKRKPGRKTLIRIKETIATGWWKLPVGKLNNN